MSHIVWQGTGNISGNFLNHYFFTFTVRVLTVNCVQIKQHSIHFGTCDAVVCSLKGIY